MIVVACRTGTVIRKLETETGERMNQFKFEYKTERLQCMSSEFDKRTEY